MVFSREDQDRAPFRLTILSDEDIMKELLSVSEIIVIDPAIGKLIGRLLVTQAEVSFSAGIGWVREMYA